MAARQARTARRPLETGALDGQRRRPEDRAEADAYVAEEDLLLREARLYPLGAHVDELAVRRRSGAPARGCTGLASSPRG